MYRHMLLPTDGSELSARAVGERIRLARALAAQVTALHVTPPFYPEGENYIVAVALRKMPLP